MNIVASLEKQSKPFWVITGAALIAGVGVVDFLTGKDLSFSLFYLLPISLVTWYAGRDLGIAASVFSALVWLSAELYPGHAYSHPAIYFWNTAIRFSFFIIVTLLLSALREAHEHERELARIDSLTGAVNTRHFAELVQSEMARSQRYKHPLTIAYLDLDDFKAINDQFGHSVGDQLLYAIVREARAQMRNVDVAARLGGDEFAFLFPETDQAAAQVAMSRIQAGWQHEMRQQNWPVTFSIGVLTCVNMPQQTDELIKLADELMYTVKNNGKNSICYSVYAG